MRGRKVIRRATEQDICAIEEKYHDLLVYEAKHGSHTNWVLDVYPVFSLRIKDFQPRVKI